jgi:hypothetical protein
MTIALGARAIQRSRATRPDDRSHDMTVLARLELPARGHRRGGRRQLRHLLRTRQRDRASALRRRLRRRTGVRHPPRLVQTPHLPYWHAFVPGLGAGQVYAYRAVGPSTRREGFTSIRQRCCSIPLRCRSGQSGGKSSPILSSWSRQARKGLRLLNFNVEAQCTPTQSALMTGRFSIPLANTKSRSGAFRTVDAVGGYQRGVIDRERLR